MAEITDRNFNEIFKTYLKANPDAWRMIRPPSIRKDGDLNKEQSLAWFRYLKDKGMDRRWVAWRALIAIGKSVMVPCEDPGLFDLAYVPKPYLAPPKRTEEDMTVMRERIGKLFRKLAIEIRGKYARQRPSEPQEPPSAEIYHPDDLPPLSAAARRIFGEQREKT